MTSEMRVGAGRGRIPKETRGGCGGASLFALPRWRPAQPRPLMAMLKASRGCWGAHMLLNPFSGAHSPGRIGLRRHKPGDLRDRASPRQQDRRRRRKRRITGRRWIMPPPGGCWLVGRRRLAVPVRRRLMPFSRRRRPGAGGRAGDGTTGVSRRRGGEEERRQATTPLLLPQGVRRPGTLPRQSHQCTARKPIGWQEPRRRSGTGPQPEALLAS